MSRLPDIQLLLAPIDGPLPCGPELDYDDAFIALERAIAGEPERQYGETIIPAETADFSQVMQQACALLERSKDLRIAAMAARGLTRTLGIDGAVHGLQLVSALIERYWDALHPELEMDGERDPLPRGNALSTLTAVEGLLGDLRAARLATRLMGQLELGELERAAAGREGATLSRSQVQQLLQEEALQGNPQIEQLRSLHRLAHALDQTLRDRLGLEAAPDFHPLLGLLDLLQPPRVAEDASDEASDSADAQPTPVDTAGGGLLTLRTRQDAIAVLEAVCQFLERHEPANPAPLLIRRARGLIGLDFLSILRELAPYGVPQAEHLAGVRE
jgi:type VI secretion system protein ImpA